MRTISPLKREGRVMAEAAVSDLHLHRIAHRVASAGLQPVIDQDRAVVLAICPSCGSPDTEGSWRSLVLCPADGRRRAAVYCTNDGCHGDVQQALSEAIAVAA